VKRLLLIAGLALSPVVAAAPYVPAAGDTVVALLPARDDALRLLRARVAAQPDDVTAAVALARRCIALGRANADPRYFGQAQAALAAWWSKADAPDSVRLLRAELLQNGHRFDAAKAELRRLTAADPRNAQAWLTLATVQAVQGDSAAATRSCARLSGLAGQLEAFTCLAGASANTPRMRGSEKLLDMALRRDPEATPAVRTWALTLLAEFAARRDDATLADQRFRSALRVTPRDIYLLDAYADFLLDQRRAREVPALLRGRDNVDGLLLRQALALRQLGDERALAPVRETLQARFNAAHLRGDDTHLREQARFTLHVLGDARTALALALRNWQVQKELADTRILLEAGLAARDRQALRPVTQWVRTEGVDDAAIARLMRRAP